MYGNQKITMKIEDIEVLGWWRAKTKQDQSPTQSTDL